MAFYFSSETMAFYDTDIFPVDSLPENKVEVNEADYTDLMQKQNQGYVIKADNSGNPYAVAQGEATATDMKHSGSIATALVLGHVKIGNTMQTANDGTLDLRNGAVDSSKIADNAVFERHIFNGAVTEDKLATQAVGTTKIANKAVTTEKLDDQAVTTPKIADANVTTEKIANGAVTEEKLESVKDLLADETTLTMSENANVFTMSVKDGGIDANQIANGAIRQQHLNAYAVTTNALNTGAVTTEKIANSAVSTDKIQGGSVTLVKLAEDTRPVLLPFKDSSNNDLNGTDWGDTWADPSIAKMVGKIGTYAAGRFVDFTLSFGFRVPNGQIPADFSFTIFLGNIDAHVSIESRTVNVTDDSYFVHERFTFRVQSASEIQVWLYPGSVNRARLSNLQLHGLML